MTKLNDAIYNLSKNYYYEIMDFFYKRDEAFFFFKKKETFCIGGLRPWACPLGLAYTKSNHFLVFLGSREQDRKSVV